jgi:two-component sensor histidine kinase
MLDRIYRADDAADGERGVMLREMNHRSKNIMQSVAASLQMRARRSDNAEVKAALTGAAGRVVAMAASQALLYRAGNGECVAVGAYLAGLCESLARMRRDEGLAVEIAVTGESPSWPEHTASWLGMAAMEAVMNSLRHAFDGQARAIVRVHLDRQAGGWLLRVWDNGRGYDPVNASRGLGTDLMTAFAGYLGGAVEMQSRPGAGTAMLLRFPEPA